MLYLWGYLLHGSLESIKYFHCRRLPVGRALAPRRVFFLLNMPSGQTWGSCIIALQMFITPDSSSSDKQMLSAEVRTRTTGADASGPSTGNKLVTNNARNIES